MTLPSQPPESSNRRRPRTLAPRVLARSVRRAEDTALGCRNLADRGLAQAAMMDTVNGRARMEASAAVWLVRAQLLDRVESSEQARLAAGRVAEAATKLRLEVPAMPTEAMTRQLEGKPVIGL